MDELLDLMSKIKVIPDDEVPPDAFYVCVPVDWGDSSVPSESLPCTVCEQPVWCSKETGMPHIERGLTPICLRCVTRMLGAGAQARGKAVKH